MPLVLLTYVLHARGPTQCVPLQKLQSCLHARMPAQT